MEKDEFDNLNIKIDKEIKISLKALENAKRMIEEVEINIDESQRQKMIVVKTLLGSSIKNVGTWPINTI